MIQAAIDYAKQLIKMDMPKENVQDSAEILEAVPELKIDLEDPGVSLEKKHSVIEHVFPEKIRNFLKVLTDNDEFRLFDSIKDAFLDLSRPPEEREITAELICVTPPTKEQLDHIYAYLKNQFKKDDLIIEQRIDKSIKSGFIIKYKSDVYDWSEEGRAAQLREHLNKAVEKNEDKDFSRENIIKMLNNEVDNFELQAKDNEVGTVKRIADGIALIDGIDHAFYGEIILFDSGVKGMVQDVRRDEIGVILLGSEDNTHEGTRVVRTGQLAGVPVGDGYLGRVVNALGEPVDGGGEIKCEEFRPIECPAPGIVDRKPVTEPMETGILAIDSMFPIGRGQRELIIGDRQTGKTSIALDTIINQKGKDTICIYVAIGQKASTIAKLVTTLKKHDALDYTIIVQATASEPAALQYIAPYAGTSIGEYFMYHGKDVLIVYDDLSKHAVAYRAISLLLERSPGREAYPGDVFYLHSRLLERSSRLSDEAGGGSITALPIIETQDGDVSAYIPTNVISITDGQIFLESDLFNEGQRPAVNVGLSVSRVGGAAQTKAMKKAAGTLRIDLAQYKEMEVFTQFSSDLDQSTKDTLTYGKSLMELIKQPLGHPLSMPEQVITLVAATARVFTKVKNSDIKEFQTELLEFFRQEHPEVIEHLETKKNFGDKAKEKITRLSGKFLKRWIKDNYNLDEQPSDAPKASKDVSSESGDDQKKKAQDKGSSKKESKEASGSEGKKAQSGENSAAESEKKSAGKQK